MPAAYPTIALTDPFAKGPHVLEAQSLLVHNPFGNFHPGGVDGSAGPLFFAAVHRAKWALGYPRAALRSSFGPKLRAFLKGDRKLPVTYRLRRRRRLHHQEQHPSVRTEMVRWCNWGIANEPQIHYDQIRPIPVSARPGTLPLDTDCSGSTTLFARWAGAPDPNGNNYSGYGYTGSMAAHLRQIPKEALQLGDLVIFGNPTHHVAVVIGLGADPVLESHGLERGPLRIALSQESRYHAGEAVRFFSLL